MPLDYVRVKVKIMYLFDVTDFWQNWKISFSSISMDLSIITNYVYGIRVSPSTMLMETKLAPQKLTTPQRWHQLLIVFSFNFTGPNWIATNFA